MRWGSSAAVAAVSLIAVMCAAPAPAQVPPEWPGAARAILGELEKGSPLATRPFKDETRQGAALARKWRLHTNRSTEVVLAEYLAMVTLCRWSGCANDMIAGKPIPARGAEVKAEKARHGGSDATVDASRRWLEGLAGPDTAAAKKNAALWAGDRDTAAADFSVSNIYTLGWVLAREQPDASRQASMMGIFGLYVHGKGWFGDRCLDITRLATVIDAPPKVEACK